MTALVEFLLLLLRYGARVAMRMVTMRMMKLTLTLMLMLTLTLTLTRTILMRSVLLPLVLTAALHLTRKGVARRCQETRPGSTHA